MYRPIEIVDTYEDWNKAQPNPPSKRFRRGTHREGPFANIYGLEVKLALVRAPNYSPSNHVAIGQSADVYKLMRGELYDQHVEYFYVLLLSTKNSVTGVYEAHKGSVRNVEVYPAEIFRAVLASGQPAFIVVHNHPSGDTLPSSEDKALTTRIKEGAKLLSLTMLDHVIIGADGYYSFADMGLL